MRRRLLFALAIAVLLAGLGLGHARRASAERDDLAWCDRHRPDDLRGRLGSERWARAHAAGRKLSIDALLKEIDRAVNS